MASEDSVTPGQSDADAPMEVSQPTAKVDDPAAPSASETSLLNEDAKSEEAKDVEPSSDEKQSGEDTAEKPMEVAVEAGKDSEDQSMDVPSETGRAMDVIEEEGDEGAKIQPVDEQEDGGKRTPPPRPKRAAARASEQKVASVPKSGRGRKRSAVEASPNASATKTPKRGAPHKHRLTWEDFVDDSAVGDRVLSCGEGDQLGHPGRTTSKKPRKVDCVEDDDLPVIQVVAGGVHSLLLTKDGTVYTCGINEKGTAPGEGVEAEGSSDQFLPIIFTDDIKKEGRIVQVTAGASFSAALTDLGSVIAWGNLRDSSGLMEVHPLLSKMNESPVVVVHHKKKQIVKIAAGENHLAMLSAEGELLTFGDGSMGQLGRSLRVTHIRAAYMCDERHLIVRATDPSNKNHTLTFVDIFAAGFWTIAKTEDHKTFVFGLNNYNQLGVDLTLGGKKTEVDSEELRVLLPTHSPVFDGHEWTDYQGVQHVVVRSKEGELYGIGRNVDNALGLGTYNAKEDDENWKYDELQKIVIPGVSAGVTAKLTCSVAWDRDGKGYAWGVDTSGQLGLGITDDDDKVVPTPREIKSAHLDGYKIISASIADNHTLFLAKKI